VVTESFIRLIDYLVNFWNSPNNISLDKNIYIGFYGGEPLMNMEFIKEIVSYVKTLKLNKNRITFSMTTNAVLLDKFMDFIAEQNVSLLISLDGDEYCNSYRVFHNGKHAHKKIVDNINLLRKKYPDYYNQMVNFNTVLHNRNSVEKVYEYFTKNFDKTPSIGELNTDGISEDMQEEFWKAYSNTMDSLYKSKNHVSIEKDMFIKLPSIQSIGSFIHNLNNFSVSRYNEFFNSANNSNAERIPTGTCLPFKKKIFVTATGKVLACERIGHQFSLGSVDGEKVNLDLEKIAKKYNSYYEKLEKLCKNCYNNASCSMCMFYCNIDEEYPKCDEFMNNGDYQQYLASHMGYLENNRDIYSRVLKEVVVD